MLFSPLWKHLLQGSPRISPGTCMRDISIENFIIEGVLDKAMLRPKEQLWKPPCIGLNVQTILCWHRSLSTIGVKNLDVHNFHGVRIAEADQSHYSKGLWGSPVFPLFFSYLLWPAWTTSSVFYAHGQLLGDDVRLSWLGRLVVDFWGSCYKAHEMRLKAAFKIKINDFSTFQNILIKRIRTLLVQAGFWEWDVMLCLLSAWIFLQRQCLSSVRRKWQII